MTALVALLASFVAVPAVAQENIPSPPPAAPVAVQVGCIGCVPAVPAVIYRPVVTYQPLQLQSVGVYQRRYATPIRTALFGRYRFAPVYAPAQVQNDTIETASPGSGR